MRIHGGDYNGGSDGDWIERPRSGVSQEAGGVSPRRRVLIVSVIAQHGREKSAAPNRGLVDEANIPGTYVPVYSLVPLRGIAIARLSYGSRAGAWGAIITGSSARRVRPRRTLRLETEHQVAVASRWNAFLTAQPPPIFQKFSGI